MPRSLAFYCALALMAGASLAHGQGPAGLELAPPEFEQLPPPESTPESTLDPSEALPPGILVPPAPPPKIWSGAFELGLDGAEGNTETFNFRLGVRGKRETPANVLTLDLTYGKNSADGEETANKALFDVRDEWLFGESPWTLYAHGAAEYDEFKAFDVRLSADAGVGYRFLKTDATCLTGRFGPGVSQEIGGPDDSLVPEAVFGLEGEHLLSARQKLFAATNYLPAIDDFGDYRLNGKAGWELLVDPVWNLSLQLAVNDRYDSTPHGARHNDLDYSLLFLWAW